MEGWIRERMGKGGKDRIMDKGEDEEGERWERERWMNRRVDKGEDGERGVGRGMVKRVGGMEEMIEGERKDKK